MIDRKKLTSLHNPKLFEIDKYSPLTVGNGEIAFTADVTGLQTLYNEYKDVPLCTMSQWGWHTSPTNADKETYTLKDLKMTKYNCTGKQVIYPQREFKGNEYIYHWLRHNPHRLNLSRIKLQKDNTDINTSMLSEINQELDLYTGILNSKYKILGTSVKVKTACSEYGDDTLGFNIETKGFIEDKLNVAIDFPYGSHLISGSDWVNKEKHKTLILNESRGNISIMRILDKDIYYMTINSNGNLKTDLSNHCIYISCNSTNLNLTIKFGKNEVQNSSNSTSIFEKSKLYFKNFWNKGGIVKLNESADKRAIELERRIILSQYLMAINSSGSAPPQETGLTCNSWYGKMHLEMYFWHCSWLALWNHTNMLERSINWYRQHLNEAIDNAKINGYKGARWPKMVSAEAIDSPSPIAPLLIWQQPHIIFMLELGYKENKNHKYLEKYWEIVKETAIFMVDFVQWNNETKKYNIEPPVIPVQECHKEINTLNPAFEIEYWRVTLKIALNWARRLKIKTEKKWLHVANNMAELKEYNGVYLAHERCLDTFTKFNIDHPSMLTYGVLPSDRINKRIMENTLNFVLNSWNYETMWGWDFAVMAMTAVRLNKPEIAIDILLKTTPKNCYLKSGNNMQITRKDLPLYLPGNGSLLIAIALMTAGYTGCGVETPGFPKDGNWKVEFENIHQYL
ncbi:MAG: hypothetical protein ACK5LT_03340 [Lachnospirales bacterium]